MEGVVFRGCAMRSATFTRAKGVRVVFDDCLLEEADLTAVSLPGTRFDDSVFRGTLLHKSNLRGSSFSGAELSGVLGVASLAGTTITPIQIVPVGERFIAEAGITIDDEAG
ncbi:MAG: pentapeptide repeat-containing protein [Acidimicrobiales bacterium]